MFAGTQSAKTLPVPHLAMHSQIRGAQVTFLQTVCQQKLDNYEYQELETDQATQQDNMQFYILILIIFISIFKQTS